MRPSYVVMILIAAAVAAMAVVGPLRGRSVESGFQDVGGAIQSAFSGFRRRREEGDRESRRPRAHRQPAHRPQGHRVGRIHRPLRRGRVRRGARPRLRLSDRGEVHGRPGREGGRSAVRHRSAPVRARAGAGQGAARPGQGQRQQRPARCGARQAAAGARLHLQEDVRRSREPDARGGVLGEDRRGPRQGRRARAQLLPHHGADLRPHQPHAGDARQLRQRRRPTPARRSSPPSSCRTRSTSTSTSARTTPSSISAWRRPSGKTSDGILGAAVGIGLPDENGFPHDAKLDFLDNRLDEGTGTLRARAILANKDGLFSPGMFARVRLQGSPQYEALMLPDEAIGTDQATSSSTSSATTASRAAHGQAGAARRRAARHPQGVEAGRLGHPARSAARAARPEGRAEARAAHRLGRRARRRRTGEAVTRARTGHAP